jgi:hypothetical protein
MTDPFGFTSSPLLRNHSVLSLDSLDQSNMSRMAVLAGLAGGGISAEYVTVFYQCGRYLTKSQKDYRRFHRCRYSGFPKSQLPLAIRSGPRCPECQQLRRTAILWDLSSPNLWPGDPSQPRDLLRRLEREWSQQRSRTPVATRYRTQRLVQVVQSLTKPT